MKLYILYNKFFLLWCISLLLWVPSSVFAFSSLQVSVEVIKADRNSREVDPQLKDLVKELTPVLNYSGFTLLKKSVIKLAPEEKAEVILSSSRMLRLQFLGFEADQARLLVRIVEKELETFRTTLLIVDKGSVLIGGPPHERGVLLLRIGGEFKGSGKQ
jgi:hypothetical protein